MTSDEVWDLLECMARIDLRRIGPSDRETWEPLVGDLPLADAKAAVILHYRDSRERIMPADIRRGVTAIRSARLAAASDDLPTGDVADDPRAYLASLRRTRAAVAEGRPVLRQIGSKQ